MFKVSEVAEMLSVEKVRIFEALIVHDTLLSPYVTKQRHLSYISEVGVRKLEQLIFSKNIEEELLMEDEIEIEIQDVVPEPVDQLDQFIEKSELKKSELRNEIIDLKRTLSILDKDIKNKSELVTQYQMKLSKDLKLTHNLIIKIESEHKIKEVTKQTFFSKIKK